MDALWDLHLSRKWATWLGVKLALYLVEESKAHPHQLLLVKHLHEGTLALIFFLHATQQNVSLSVKIQEHACGRFWSGQLSVFTHRSLVSATVAASHCNKNLKAHIATYRLG